MTKCLERFTQSTYYSCPILMKLEVSRPIFDKYSNIKFYDNPARESLVVSLGWTDGRTDIIVAFPSFANAPHIYHGLTKIVDQSQIRTQN